MQTYQTQLAPQFIPAQLKVISTNIMTPQGHVDTQLQYKTPQIMQISPLQPTGAVYIQKPSVKRITSSMDEKKEKHCVRTSVEKKKRNTKAVVKVKQDKKSKESEAKKPNRVRSMPLTQQNVSEINKLHYIQKMNRVREWVNQDQEDCLYPLFY